MKNLSGFIEKKYVCVHSASTVGSKQKQTTSARKIRKFRGKKGKRDGLVS